MRRRWSRRWAGFALAGAGLDVWTFEPAIDPRLLALPNVVMTPHMGSATYKGAHCQRRRTGCHQYPPLGGRGSTARPDPRAGSELTFT